MRGSKGVHIAVARERIGNVDALTLIAPQDGRVMFILPAGDFSIVGTTDTFEDVEPAQVRPSEADVQYLIGAANHFFPAARLLASDVVSAWAGLRPLAAVPGDARDPGAASREHAISEAVPGLVSVTGGKLTTYRAMAAEVVDLVQRVLGKPRGRAATDVEALPGGAGCDVAREIAAAITDVGDEAVAVRLVHAHGTTWRAIWQLVTDDATLGARVEPSRPYLLAELRYAVAEEMALTLGDLLIRRVPLAFETRDNGRTAARRVAALVAEWLGWTTAETATAVLAYDAEVTRIFAVEAATPS